MIRSTATALGAFLAPPRAVLFIVSHPSVWPACAGPLVINVVCLWAAWHYSGVWADAYLTPVEAREGWLWDVAYYAAIVLKYVMRGLVALVAFVIVGNLASIPFNDWLSERVDQIAGGWRSNERLDMRRWMRSLAFTAFQEMRRLALFAGLSLMLLVALLVPPAAPFVAVGQFLMGSIFFALDYFSYPLERRGMLALGDKLRFIRANAAPSVAFGASMLLIFMIPVLNFLFIPLAVVGGTLVFGDVARASRVRGA